MKKNKYGYFKLLSLLLIFQLSFSLMPVIPSNAVVDTDIQLDFAPKHTVMSSDGTTLFAIKENTNQVFAINLLTKEKKSITFDLVPERLYFDNNKLYVALLISGHVYYDPNKNEKGSIAIVTPSTLTVEKRFDVNIDPFDIAVKNNIIFISSGSNQWTYSKNYSLITGLEISSVYSRFKSYISFNSNLNKLYFITTDSSPRDISCSSLDKWNKLSTEKDSPYHGDYAMTPDITISPDGKYIFNGSGNIFKSSSIDSEEMRYICNIGQQFSSVAFEGNSNFYISNSEDEIYRYDYNTFLKTGVTKIDGTINYLYNTTNNLVCVYTKNSTTFIKTISKSSFDEIVDNKIPGNLVDFVYSSKNDKAYAIDKGFGKLFTINTKNNYIENITQLDFTPSSICLSKDESKLYIANNSTTSALTEINLSDMSIRNNSSSIPLNNGDDANKEIYINNNLVYILSGEWAPTLYLFDINSLSQVNYNNQLSEIGGLAFTSDNKYMLTWRQYGWSAGSALTYVNKYSIDGTNFTKVDEYIPASYTEFGRDPLNTPILLNEENNTFILKDREFNLNNLSENSVAYPESIYGFNATKTIAVSNKNLYYLNYGISATFPSNGTSKFLFFNKDGAAYFMDNDGIKVVLPFPNDVNGDTVVDFTDLASIATGYNAKSSDPDYNFVYDLNQDNIIDIYDITLIARNISDSPKLATYSNNKTSYDVKNGFTLKPKQLNFNN